ncbi:MAG: retroviral-like aspartic protease [Hormoscilla sp.]
MLNAQRFPFIEKSDRSGVINMMPYLPLTLTYQNRPLDVLGLLDTGSSINVLPYDIGLRLGAIWERQMMSVTLAGNLEPVEARGLLVSAKVGRFPTVNLVFAWAQANDIPLILGRSNFFQEFDVCFYCSQLAFEVCPCGISPSGSN